MMSVQGLLAVETVVMESVGQVYLQLGSTNLTLVGFAATAADLNTPDPKAPKRRHIR